MQQHALSSLAGLLTIFLASLAEATMLGALVRTGFMFSSSSFIEDSFEAKL